jgi:type III restriction enzyme
MTRTGEDHTGDQRELDRSTIRNVCSRHITMETLKEGWDCSFAYVLCSVSAQSHAIEQLLGRVLRMLRAHAVSGTEQGTRMSCRRTARGIEFTDHLEAWASRGWKPQEQSTQPCCRWRQRHPAEKSTAPHDSKGRSGDVPAGDLPTSRSSLGGRRQ